MKKRIAALLALCLTLGCLTACGGGGSSSGAESASGSVSTGAAASVPVSSGREELVPPLAMGEATLPEGVPQKFAFSDNSGMWANFLALNPDGSFASAYTDVVVDEVGEGYPNGTIYYCDHEDQFRDIRQINSYSWSMVLEVEEGEMEFGEVYVENDVCHVFTEPYGLTGGSSFILYSPDAPLAELDEALLNWYPGQTGEQTTLGCWAIYNEVMGHTFFSVEEG